VPTFYFVGVTTGKSSINKVFPLWMEVLGRPEVVLEGIDHKIHDDPEVYRATVAQMKYDPNSLGALVTTHKLDCFAAAEDMFDYFDPYAQVTRELSSISKRDGRLEGHAKDPITAGLSLDHIIEPGYFARTGGHILCLGRAVRRWLLCSTLSTKAIKGIGRRGSSPSTVRLTGWNICARWSATTKPTSK
jgi:shikimate dehydrogenase